MSGSQEYMRMFGYREYMSRYNLRGNSHLYYGVACPNCGAFVGDPCFHYSGKWSPPHVARIRRAQLSETRKVHTIFVYGTLKRGYNNYSRLLRNADFLGEAISVDKDFQMVSGGVPFLAKTGNSHDGHAVKGELFYVTNEQFAACDRLEGHPRFYCREEHNFKLANGNEVKAWVYLCPSRVRDGTCNLVKPTNGVIEWRPA